MQLWLIEAIDTVFFRGNRSFNQGETGTQDIASIFPPPISSLQGLIRTALAMEQGWHPDGVKDFPPELGDENCLGKLRLLGPYLKDEEDWLFPIPLHLVKDQHNRFNYLIPSTETYQTDLGKRALPTVANEQAAGIKPINGLISRKGLQKVLQGGLPDTKDIRLTSDLWSEEARVGIEIDQKTGTAKESMLYRIKQVRPVKKLQIGVLVGGDISSAWHPKNDFLMPLGGEGRMARISVEKEKDIIPPLMVPTKAKYNIVATLLTPGHYDNKMKTNNVIQYGPFHAMGINCLSACIGKIQQVGGWDLKGRIPRPLMPIVPAGSTWFYQLNQEEWDKIKVFHGKTTETDRFKGYGYGQIGFGTWKEDN